MSTNGDVAREIEVPEVGEILNPTWSPDGKSIAFSATVGGDSDLFIYNLESGTTRRVTTDLFADLQPAWSPDGEHDRVRHRPLHDQGRHAQAGDYRLALVRRRVRRASTPLPTFPQGKNINPQWNPDSRRLFFVSDQNGISNVYSVDVQSGALAQITNVDSGVSGITGAEPGHLLRHRCANAGDQRV